jgi:hypothetical protein
MNCDQVFTISDVGLWLHQLYFLPGDGLIAILLTDAEIARFLELTPALYGGWISGVLSLVGWSLCLNLIFVVLPQAIGALVRASAETLAGIIVLLTRGYVWSRRLLRRGYAAAKGRVSAVRRKRETPWSGPDR